MKLLTRLSTLGLLALHGAVWGAENTMYYADGDFHPTTKDKAVYQFTKPYPASDNHPDHYRVDYYYKDSKQLYSSQLMLKQYITDPLSSPTFGEVVFFHPDGSLKAREHFDEQGAQGIAYLYPKNRQPEADEFVDDKLNGLARIYYAPQQVTLSSFPECQQEPQLGKYEVGCVDKKHNLPPLETLIEFKKGVKQWEKTFYPRGKLKSEMAYRNGKLHGVSKSYTEQGQLTHQVAYVNGEKSGEEKQWVGNTLIKSCHYLNGRRDGKCAYWTNDGTPRSVEYYKQDKRNGLSQRFDSQGRLMSEVHYQMNYSSGTATEYYANGQKKSVRDYTNKVRGRPGLEQFWDKNGRLTNETERKITRDHGEVWVETTYDQSGLKWVNSKAVSSGWRLREAFTSDTGKKVYHLEHDGKRYDSMYKTGLFFSYLDENDNPSDTAKETGYYRHGKLDGDYILVNSHGEILAKGRYKNGEKMGHWTRNTGSYLHDDNYDKQGRQDGVSRVVDLDSGAETVRHYRHGKLFGDYRITDKSGNLLVKGQYANDQKQGEWFEGGDMYFRCDSYAAATCIGDYHQGHKTGKWVGYNKQGYIISVGFFNQKGNKEGRQYTLFDNGKVDTIDIYKDGKMSTARTQ